jgi:hypothetical protein
VGSRPQARRRPAKAATAKAPGILEKELQANILALCKQLRLRTAHFPPLLAPDGRWVTPLQGDAKGFTDLVIVGPGGVIFAEIKTNTGRVAPDQRAWHVDLEAAGALVRVWRTRHWRDGTIARELQALRRRPATP